MNHLLTPVSHSSSKSMLRKLLFVITSVISFLEVNTLPIPILLSVRWTLNVRVRPSVISFQPSINQKSYQPQKDNDAGRGIRHTSLVGILTTIRFEPSPATHTITAFVGSCSEFSVAAPCFTERGSFGPITVTSSNRRWGIEG